MLTPTRRQARCVASDDVDWQQVSVGKSRRRQRIPWVDGQEVALERDVILRGGPSRYCCVGCCLLFVVHMGSRKKQNLNENLDSLFKLLK